MNSKRSIATLITGIFLLAAASAQAGLIINQVAGDPTMAGSTPIDTSSLNTNDLVTSLDGVNFQDGNGDPLVALVGGTTSPGSGVIGDNWWNPGTYPILTTGLPSDSSSIFIDLSGLNVYGFSFQIGANQTATGWVRAWGDAGSDIKRTGISIGPSNSPGIQVASSRGSCERITRIQVEPPFTWGIFNLAMDQVGDNCAQVPEPGSLSLLGAGLLGLGLLQRSRRRRAGSAV